MAQTNENPSPARSLAWIALIAIAVALVVLIIWKAGAAAKRMSSVIASDGQALSHLHARRHHKVCREDLRFE